MEPDPILDIFLEDDTPLLSGAVVVANMENIVQGTAADIEVLHGVISEEYNIDCESGPSNIDFFQNVPNLSDLEFVRHFRMERATMQQKLIEYLKAKIPAEKLSAMIVPFEKKVHLTVWLLANKDSYRAAGILFKLHKSTVSVVFHEICDLLSESRYDFIKWPTPEELETIKNAVLKRHKFPNCVGFIDGCHIQILAPKNNPVDFHNRKEVHSVVLQAVCDQHLKFINIFLGQTGRAHDARVFRESNLGDELSVLVPNDYHILGDSAYTLSPQLLTPYRDTGNLSEAQKKYNTIHSGTRAYIERAFGLLKGKFRRLKYLELHSIDEVSVIICAACVLHNFIIINEQNATVDVDNEQENFYFDGLSATEKRDQISAYLSG